MNDYQQEQWDALEAVRRALPSLSISEREALQRDVRDYLRFRQQVDQFLSTHFSDRCSASCYENRRSACCSKDGIITFWADVVINAICSSDAEMADLEKALKRPVYDYKCTYLGRNGCRWRIRPLGCALFLCDEVQACFFGGDDKTLKNKWLSLTETAKRFRWPDQPVLFDRLEIYFMERGWHSPLMYINSSPGLMRIKRLAGLPLPEGSL